MANQDPQPEIYTTRHTFTGATTSGNTNTVSVFTTETDFAVSVQVGPNSVPSNQFDVGWLAANIANGGNVLAFSTPILVLFQQPLAIKVEVKTTTTATRTVVVDLIGELAIQKEYYDERFSNGSPQ